MPFSLNSFFAYINPLHSKISINILNTLLETFGTDREDLFCNKSFLGLQSFPLFSWI